MMYETKFKINRKPLIKLWREYSVYCNAMPDMNEVSAERMNECIDECDRLYQSYKDMERYLDGDAWNVFMRSGMVQDPESKYYDGKRIDWDRHIMLKHPRARDHVWVKFELTRSNVDAFNALLSHLTPVLTTMQRFKMVRDIEHKIMLQEASKATGITFYPYLGTIKPYNDAEVTEADIGLLNMEYEEIDISEVKSVDFKRWKDQGLDRFEFTLSLRDTPNFNSNFDPDVELDCREYYDMAL